MTNPNDTGKPGVGPGTPGGADRSRGWGSPPTISEEEPNLGFDSRAAVEAGFALGDAIHERIMAAMGDTNDVRVLAVMIGVALGATDALVEGILVDSLTGADPGPVLAIRQLYQRSKQGGALSVHQAVARAMKPRGAP